MSNGNETAALPTWAVAVEDRRSTNARERGESVCRSLEHLGCSVELVEDGNPAGLKVDVLLFMENLADFGVYQTMFARRLSRRPITALWMLETLPPESLTREAERVGITAARWRRHLGLQFPKRRMSPVQKLVTLRNLRHWLYKQISRTGFRQTLALLRRHDENLRDTGWMQIRGAMQNWECLRRVRREGWLDHCIVSTAQRQRFLEQRGWKAPFVPVGRRDEDGRALDLERDLDVVFLGYLRNDRRASLLEWLGHELTARGISLRVITGGCYGEERTRLLNRAKIVVMLHQYAWSPAWIRFFHASACGACVVSEPMPDDRPFRAGIDYAAAAIGEMPAMIERLLADESARKRLVNSANELCTTTLTLHNSVRQIVAIATQSFPT